MEKCKKSQAPFALKYNKTPEEKGTLNVFLESNLPLIEKYLLAEKPEDVINTLEANTPSYFLLKLLSLSPSSEEFLEIHEKLNKEGIVWANDLFLNKIPIAIKDSSIPESEKIMLLEKCQDKLDLDFTQYVEPPSIAVKKTLDNSNKLPSEVSSDDFSIGEYIKVEKKKIFRTITKLGLRELGVEELLKLAPNEKEIKMIIGCVGDSSYDDNAISLLKYLYDITRSNYTSSIEPYQHLLTLSQLQTLGKTLPDISERKEYIKALYEKMYGEQLRRFSSTNNKELSNQEKELKHILLVEAVKWLNSYSIPSLRSFVLQINYEILSLGLEMKKFDIPLFLEYIDNPNETSTYFNQAQREVCSKNRSKVPHDRYWGNVHSFESQNVNTNSFIENYIPAYFNSTSNPQVELFYKYFDRQKIDEWFALVRLARGDSVVEIGNIIDYNRLQTLRNEKKLAFVENSRAYYGVDDPVVLNLRVKNITQITAEIYEISTQKHYLSCDNDISDTIAIDFIQPFKKVSKDIVLKNQFKYEEVQFDLSNILQKKNSIYIIDFVGAELYCRAVIRKGSMICIERSSIAGIQLNFYEQNGTKIDELDIWIENKKIPVVGSYVIPFRQKEETVKVVAVKNGFASLHKICVPTEEYDFKLNYIYDKENFLVGNKAKVLLQARLQLNGLPAPMAMVKQTVITVNITNHQGINTSFDLRNIKWDYKSQFQLEIPIQNPLSSIEISLKAKVQKYKDSKRIENKTIIYSQPPNANETISFFLTKSKNEYVVRALGINAEPKPSLTVNVRIESLLFRQKHFKQYITDQNGEIKLGDLKNIQSIEVSASEARQQTWNLSKDSQVNFVEKVIARIDEQINLPTYSGFKLNEDVEVLYYGSSNTLIKKVASNIALKDQRLLISLKQQGIYKIRFLKINKDVIVTVTDGVFWERTSQLYSKKNKEVIISYPQAHSYIGLSDKIDVKQSNGKYNVKCHLTCPKEINRESVRVHVFANYFNYNNQISKLRANYIRNVEPTRVRAEPPKSSYLDNQNLSDEHCYIINRQKAKKYIGNALSKPKILLSRTETKCTSDASGSGDKPISYGATGHLLGARAGYGGANTYYSPGAQYNDFISSANGFLKYSSLVLPNLSEGNIQFEVPKHYRSIRVLVTSQSFAIEKEFDLPIVPLETKDLRHSGLDETKTGLTMSRNCYKLRKGDSLIVNRSSVWASISGQNINSFCRAKNQLLKGWVLGWETYDTEKKKEVYSKNICHETNTYIKYKDEEFFASVVRPFLENKLQKGIVDYCLLEDDEALKYLELNKLILLNPFEKCLLVDYLVKTDKIKEAQALTNSLRLAQKATVSSFEQYQKLFDTAINCKLSEDNPDVIPTNATMFQGGQDNLLQFNVEPYMHQQIAYNQPYQHQYMDSFGNANYASPEVFQTYNNNAFVNQGIPMAYADYDMLNVVSEEAPIEQPMRNARQQQQMQSLNRNMFMNAQVRTEHDAVRNLELRNQFKKGFNEIEKTKQYIETTYFDLKYPSESTNQVKLSKFWVELAEHFLKGENKGEFLSENFIYLQTRVEFTLAFCFIPNPFSAKYNLKSEGDSVIITAQTSFLVFVKEVKSVEFKKRADIIVTQHFYDPQDQFTIGEDNERVEKTLTEFVKNKRYGLKTIITNISQSNLQLQILLDIPQGSIPLSSQQYTQIKSESLNSYSIKSFVVDFYFPQSGTFKVHPSNVSKKGEVIARAEQFGPVVVKDELVSQNLNDLRGILDSGTAKDVLNFLKEKNIFDENVFDFDPIMWMMKDKEFFKSVIEILKSRLYFSQDIWEFGIYHKDIETVSELLTSIDQFQSKYNTLNIFEYYPLSSKRAHKHLKGAKNQILNQNFKATYENFLLSSFIQNDLNNPVFIIVFTYYLILQDRIEEADLLFKKLKSITKTSNYPQIQCDYISCFLDIYTGYPNFVTAREISAKYVDYPVEQWRQIFKDVYDLLNTHDTVVYEEDQTREYEIKFINKGNNLRVLLPEKTSVELSLFAINLELFFSSAPFSDKDIVISVQPFKVIKVESKDGGEEKIEKPQQYPDIYVVPRETSAVKSGQTLSPFLWNNDSVKVKLLEDNGVAVVFVDGKPKPGTYCKVYAKSKNGSIDFYKDGYTDLQGKFVYAASDLSQIDKFAILFKTDKGGLIKQARKPNAGGVFEV